MLSKMKYLKTYNEAMNLRNEIDEINNKQMSNPGIDHIQSNSYKLKLDTTKKYFDKLKDCYLYVTDAFETRTPNVYNTLLFLLSVRVEKNDISKFIEELKSSDEKAKFELNSEIDSIQIKIINKLGQEEHNTTCRNTIMDSAINILEQKLTSKRSVFNILESKMKVDGCYLIVNLTIK